MHSVIFRLCVFSSLVFAAANSWVYAEAAKLDRDEMAKLFKLGWDLSPEARIQVDEHYSDLILASKGDGRLPYAMTLIKIKQLKYQDALKVATEIVAREKGNLQAWRAKIWLTVLTKNYSQAMVDLEKAADTLPRTDDAADARGDAYRDMATFMGRIYGFLEGPVSHATNEAERIGQRKKLVAKLSPERRVAFEEGRQSVTDKYLELTDQAIVSKERAKGDAEEEREEKLKGLDDDQQQLEKRRSDLDSNREKLRAELKSELDDLAKQDRPLAQNFASLDAQATVVRRELGIIATDVAVLQRRLNQEKDPAIRDQIAFELARLRGIGARYEVDLAALTQRAAAIAAQRVQLQQRAAVAQNNVGRQIDQADRELMDINKKTGRNIATEKKLRKPASADTPETRAKAAQAASFLTYEQFPLEREKQKLLDSFP